MNSLVETLVRMLVMFAVGYVAGTAYAMIRHNVRNYRRWKKLQRTFNELDADLNEFDRRNMA